MPEDVRLKGPAVVKATIEVYNTIRAELLPTPAKSHYTYNMRDLSKVFQASKRTSSSWTGLCVASGMPLVTLYAWLNHTLLTSC